MAMEAPRLQLWMDQDHIEKVAGLYKKPRRGIFESPQPSEVERMRQEWEARHQPAVSERSKTPHPPSSPLHTDSVFEFAELQDQDGVLADLDPGTELAEFLRLYTSRIPKKIPPPVVASRHTQPNLKPNRLAPLSGMLMGRDAIASSRSRGRVMSPSSSRHRTPRWPANATLTHRSSPEPERPWRQPVQPRPEAQPTVKILSQSLPCFTEVRPRIEDKGKKEVILDFSFCNLKSVQLLLKKEPRSGLLCPVEPDLPPPAAAATVQSLPEAPHGILALVKAKDKEYYWDRGRMAETMPTPGRPGSASTTRDERPNPTAPKFIASVLRLASNGLPDLEGFPQLLPLLIRDSHRLASLDLSSNLLTSVPNEVLALPLVVLHLHVNNIAPLAELSKLSQLARTLHTVSLAGNPVAEHHDYRLTLIAILPQLRSLDFGTVTAADHEDASLRPRPVARVKRSPRKGAR
eukprot:GGOE01045369.1.p1 GENE.GGOE01045369.1~~GGOE01045369.1.p1  ORF type:complete len:462 (-),score=122.41 GGOE01045369.1:369-1754(-)